MQYFFTNAPVDYDYGYVKTVKDDMPNNGKGKGTYRLIEVSDAYRFENFQTPRYGSGLYQAFALDGEDAEYYDLKVPPGTLENWEADKELTKLTEAVFAYAMENYGKNGWDYLIETRTHEETKKVIKESGAKTLEDACKAVTKEFVLDILGERDEDARAMSGEY